MPGEIRTASRPSTALVLTGGGARGAYEAGVLRYVLGELGRRVGTRPSFDIFTGTSVGALNACALASLADVPVEAARRLAAYWHDMAMERVLGFSSAHLARAPDILFGRRVALPFFRRKRTRGLAPHPPVAGLFDTSPLRRDMKDVVPWERIQENMRLGHVRGVALCATQVCTSQSVVFYEQREGGGYRAGMERTRKERKVTIGLDHALASAAIPFLFPAVQVSGVCYVDGALRQNIPLAPAIRLGADRVLIIGLSQEADIRYHTARLGCLTNPYPGAFFLLGRTVNALMDGMLEQQLRRIEITNQLLAAGIERYGADYLDGLNAAASDIRSSPYRVIRTLHIQPTRDLNDLAVEAIAEAPDEVDLPGAAGRIAGRIMRSRLVVDSGLASFLLFTPTYARKLLDLGYEDARRRHAELLAFFDMDRRADA